MSKRMGMGMGMGIPNNHSNPARAIPASYIRLRCNGRTSAEFQAISAWARLAARGTAEELARGERLDFVLASQERRFQFPRAAGLTGELGRQ